MVQSVHSWQKKRASPTISMAEEETREGSETPQPGAVQTPEFMDALWSVVQQELRTALTTGILADGGPGPAASVATTPPSGTNGN